MDKANIIQVSSTSDSKTVSANETTGNAENVVRVSQTSDPVPERSRGMDTRYMMNVATHATFKTAW
jgi:hypothetical protein